MLEFSCACDAVCVRRQSGGAGQEAIDVKHCDKEVSAQPPRHLRNRPATVSLCVCSQGMTALDYAVRRKHKAVERMLAPPKSCAIL